MHFLEYYFWIVSDILLLGIIFVILSRSMQRRFPLFFIYAIFDLIRSASLLIAYVFFKVSVPQYKVAAVISLAVSMVLRLGVVYELCNNLLATHPHWALRVAPFLRWTVALLLLVSAAASATQIRSGVESVENIFLSLELLWSVLFCGVVLALFTITHREYWGSYGAGIAFGFGIFAAVNLATSAFRAGFDSQGNITISIIQMASYHACVLVWLIYLFLPERKPKFAAATLHQADLDAWSEELQKIVRP